MDKCKTRSFEKYKKGIEDIVLYQSRLPVCKKTFARQQKVELHPLEEKSLGRIEKTGFTEIIVVFACGERVKE